MATQGLEKAGGLFCPRNCREPEVVWLHRAVVTQGPARGNPDIPSEFPVQEQAVSSLLVHKETLRRGDSVVSHILCSHPAVLSAQAAAGTVSL